MSLKFVGELPDEGPYGPRSKHDPIIEELKQQPGQWAEVRHIQRDQFGRGRANTLAQSLRKKGVNTAVRTVGDELVVFARFPEEQA